MHHDRAVPHSTVDGMVVATAAVAIRLVNRVDARDNLPLLCGRDGR